MPEAKKFTLDRRKVVLGLGLVGASGFAQARLPVPNKPRIKEDVFVGMIPRQVGDFAFEAESGLVLPPSDALSSRLYDNLVTRSYSSPDGQAVMLLIAYNNKQDGVLQIHRPEICYPAGGFDLTPVQPIEVPITAGAQLPGQIFAATSEVRNEVVLYWTRVGSAFPRRWLEQRLAVAEANLQGIVPDGVLARVSTISNDMGQARPVLERFIRQLHDSASPRARSLLFGAI